MNNFKKMDKVRCIKDYPHLFSVGKIYTVDCQRGKMVYVEAADNGRPDWWYEECFELVDSANAELDRLIELTNEGAKANLELRTKFAEQVEYKNNGSDSYSEWTPLNKIGFSGTLSEWRKKTFELKPFKLKDSEHPVALDGDTLEIGCVRVNAIVAREVFKTMAKGGDKYSAAGFELKATRKGVTHSKGDMTWADVDQLLAELEKIK